MRQKLLDDGETKDVKSSRKAVFKSDKYVEVLAECVDSETPYVHLTIKGSSNTVTLTDVDTEDLIDRLQRALMMLPTSK